MKRIISLMVAMWMLSVTFTSCDDEDHLTVEYLDVSIVEEFRTSTDGDPFAFFPSDYHGYAPGDVVAWYSGGRIDSDVSTSLYLFADDSFILTWSATNKRMVQAYGYYEIEFGDTLTGRIILRPVGHNEIAVEAYDGTIVMGEKPLVLMADGTVPSPSEDYEDFSNFEEKQ